MKAILFDVDGVLLDSDEKILDAFEKVGMVLGLKSPGRDFFRKKFGIPYYEIIFEAYGDRQDAVELFRKFERNFKIEFMNGAKDILKKIKIKKGIVSTKEKELIERFLAEIIQEFDVVVSGDDTREHKPNPEPLLLACKKLDVNPADAVYIGDAMKDWEMAKNAGTKFIGFVSGGATEEEFREAGVETVVHSMKELENTISKFTHQHIH